MRKFEVSRLIAGLLVDKKSSERLRLNNYATAERGIREEDDEEIDDEGKWSHR
jgi:hypothetical protein